ncbi:sensor domain-containing phosphodiesterase [Robbsia sp. Bb-Pol-6]|uniref:Sensor domain-containing phosphodiesterase n=1 Tax=Robbsia betulipollinis TaxID=2981849 RepID=A0ABT3ZGV0_9BURK|nr:sensor domain-containing phosphodiesterase [Robbsia betulipollinis]MCY0385750.1 sensor domain-containing phosphodiesterase [Robbsia betulipollinis]
MTATGLDSTHRSDDGRAAPPCLPVSAPASPDATPAALAHEAARLATLRDLRLLDTPQSEAFDRITRMASRLFGAPIAAISLTDGDRQWFKSHLGTAGRELPRHQAPCATVTDTSDLLVVEDLLTHPGFFDSPLALAGIRFYAGAPLRTRDGYTLGAMCVLDHTPRTATADEMAALHDFAALVMSQIELQHDFGRIDVMSGLPNRHELLDIVADMQRAPDNAVRVILLIDALDPQRMQEIVNALGSAYLDAFVRATSRIVKDLLTARTGLYHVGPTSYAILLDEEADGPWRDLADRLSPALTGSLMCSGIPIATNTVMGVSFFKSYDPISPAEVLRIAVSAADSARAAGVAQAIYNPANDAANRRRFALLTDFSLALADPAQLRLVYQPRVALDTGQCVSVEALLRWEHPLLGNVPPGEFIPLLEQTSLARPLTEWVATSALRQWAIWRNRGLVLRVSINVSARNLEEPDFAQRLLRQCQEMHISPNAIELEFTEGALISNVDNVREQLSDLKAIGCEIAIDDFGSGYSNFAYLQTLPATTVKLDQSFIQDMDGDPRKQQLARSMIAIAHDLDLRVVAEGVETEHSLHYLRACGCDEVQGYFICRPIEAAAFPGWLARHEAGNRLAQNGVAGAF